ncbi:MAG: ABC transporter substrate-binding protein, partial [Flavobacteriales bacterium]
MMKRYYKVIFILCVFFFGCKKMNSSKKSIKKTTFPFTYTQNIELKKSDSLVEFHFSFHESLPKKIKLPIKKIIVNGTSSLGFLEALEGRDRIVGISNPHHVYDSIIQDKIRKGSIKNIGIQGSVDIEKIVKLNPDVFFSYSDPNMIKIHQKLESLGIPVILIDEFKEKTPLAKAEWIKFFGALLNKNKEAQQFFKQVESHYNQLKNDYSSQEKKPKVLVDIMYGDVWYLPNNQSFLTKFIQDAGGSYIFKEEKREILNFSFERVFTKAKKADVWINASNIERLKELEAKNHNYRLFKAFERGEIYSLTGNMDQEANNYFEEGVVRPDLILKDLT